MVLFLSSLRILSPCLPAGGFFMYQSEEIRTFVEEINTFSEKHLTSQRKPLPLCHLLRETARRCWGVAVSRMAQ